MCATPTVKPCVDDDDCRVGPSDPSVCRFQDRKWCSGKVTQACTSDAECRTSCKTCSGVPSRTCTVDADCGLNGPCLEAPADKLGCSCGLRSVKLYNDETGLRLSLTDLLTDPDEYALFDRSATVYATGVNPKLSQRLRCCMDKWWLPPAIVGASCPNGCDPRVDCTL
jgi:hypothetical protein